MVDYYKIPGIKTRYAGHLFGSQLEARWAVFFDLLGVEWRHEPRVFDTGGTLYVPDFYLPTLKAWAEVKPGPFEDWQFSRCQRVAEQTGEAFALLIGEPKQTGYTTIVPGGNGYTHALFPAAGYGSEGWPVTARQTAALKASMFDFAPCQSEPLPEDALTDQRKKAIARTSTGMKPASLARYAARYGLTAGALLRIRAEYRPKAAHRKKESQVRKRKKRG